MPKTDKPRYEPPGLRTYKSADDLLIDYAARGDPKAFAKVLQFTRECEQRLRERDSDSPKTLARKR